MQPFVICVLDVVLQTSCIKLCVTVYWTPRHAYGCVMAELCVNMSYRCVMYQTMLELWLNYA